MEIDHHPTLEEGLYRYLTVKTLCHLLWLKDILYMIFRHVTIPTLNGMERAFCFKLLYQPGFKNGNKRALVHILKNMNHEVSKGHDPSLLEGLFVCLFLVFLLPQLGRESGIFSHTKYYGKLSGVTIVVVAFSFPMLGIQDQNFMVSFLPI